MCECWCSAVGLIVVRDEIDRKDKIYTPES
jgi:hypothetical protein